MLKTDRLIVQHFIEQHPQEAAAAFEKMLPQNAAAVLSEMDVGRSKLIIEHSGPVASASYTRCMSIEKIAPLMEAINLDIASVICRRLDDVFRNRILARINPNRREKLEMLLSYPPGTAGALMDPNALAFNGDMTLNDVRRQLKGASLRSYYYLYVINREQELMGVANMRDFVEAKNNVILSELTKKTVNAVLDKDSQMNILAHPGWQTFHALPVVNTSNKFMGVLRHEIFQKLFLESKEQKSFATLNKIGSALGELYWIGFSGFFKTLDEIRVKEHESRKS